MTKVFARECGPDGIRVNAILPGLIRTKFAGALMSDEHRSSIISGKLRSACR